MIIYMYITHVSFATLKGGFAVVLVNDASSHGIKKFTIGPIKFSTKRAIVLTPASGP